MRYSTTRDRARGVAAPAPGHGVAAGLSMAAVGVLFTVAMVGAADAAAGGPECAPVVVDTSGAWNVDGNAGEVAALRAMGWTGDPGDGAEAIYPPGCLTLP